MHHLDRVSFCMEIELRGNYYCFDILHLFVVRQKLRERKRERKLLLQKGKDIAILLGNNVSPSTFATRSSAKSMQREMFNLFQGHVI